jgi:hypothetical protein
VTHNELPATSFQAFSGNRCAGCGGELEDTKATGRPHREDHKPGCEYFDRAVQVMRFAEELQKVATELGRGSDRRYLQKGAKDLSAAACASNPYRAARRLANEHKAEYEKGTKQAEAAEVLMKTCQALAGREDPASVISDAVAALRECADRTQ